MGVPNKPSVTRYRFVVSSDLEKIKEFFNRLGVRVQLYDLVVKGGRFYQTFVPSDFGDDIRGGDLDV